MKKAQTIFALVMVLGCWSAAQAPPSGNKPALRSAVPLLCTENTFAGRTRVRGTGVIADSSGTLLTAAHVILQAKSSCTLSVLVPSAEWANSGRLRGFVVSNCHLNQPLDLAVCRIQPSGNGHDWAYLVGARLTARAAVAGDPVWVTAFTGWGLFPLTRCGRVTGRQDYRRADGCRCNFATDIVAVEGMSGSPVITASGQVTGILTLAGSGKFRGTSFGVSFEEARTFLTAEGVQLSSASGGDKP